MTCRKQGAPFQRISNGILDKIEAMDISWCQVQSYRYGTYSGWISETYMGMARVQ